jgi:tetratricopeptide (TPR) repeat protein
MSYANSEKLYVASYKEIIVTFLIFCVILFMLYPKDLIKEQIIAETSNYDLSMLYLKNMLKNDPSNESLMLLLATQSLRSGKKDLAYRLLELLHDSKNREIRYKAYRESYILAKGDYFYFEAQKNLVKKEQYYKTLKYLFKIIIYEHFYTKEDNTYLFNESLFLHDTKDAYTYALKDKGEQEIKNLKALSILCIQLKRAKEARKALEKLIKINPREDNRWKNNLYYVLYSSFSKKSALEILKIKSEKSRYWKIKLAEYTYYLTQYRESANIYMNLFSSEEDPKLKKTYFKKVIVSLNAGKYPKYAIAFAKSQEALYFNDTKMRIWILRLYLANAALEDAAKLAKKILNRRY